MTTSYDTVAYPTSLIGDLHPDRLASLARLAGMDPAEPSQARILEIGGGDCLNVLAMAAAWPECDAHGFDLSQAAIGRGQDLAARAGITNAALAVDDIMAAADRYPARSFDYVIAHGVYAWVPPHVAEATMALIGHLLSDRGVAFVSYNTLPGAHTRLIMREMLLDALGDVTDTSGRMDAARQFLEAYRARDDDPRPLAAALREEAARMLKRPPAVLFHDEINEFYHPHLLTDAVAAGARHGLAYLTDASGGMRLEGLLPAGVPHHHDAGQQVLRAAAASDFQALRVFRQSLFVRREAATDRTLEHRRIADLWMSTMLRPQGNGVFTLNAMKVNVGTGPFAAALARVTAQAPQRMQVREIATDADMLAAVMTLFDKGLVNLASRPAPFSARVGNSPRVSGLARAMLADNWPRVANLDHGMVAIEQPEIRTILLAADGTRSLDQISASQRAIGFREVSTVLQQCAGQALIA